MKLAPAIDEFVQYKQALGNVYTGSANVLKAFLRKTGDLELDDLASQHAEAFLPCADGTVTNAWFQRYWVLDRFFRYATSRGYMRHRVLPTSMPERPPDFIPYIYSTEDMRRLLGVPDSHYPRDCPLSADTMRTLILLLYGTGLRLGEACRLTHEDVDFPNAALTIRETKFGKSRSIRVIAVLSTWNGVLRFVAFHSRGDGTIPSHTWRKTKSMNFWGRRIDQVNMANETTPCCCFCTTRGRAPVKRLELRLRT